MLEGKVRDDFVILASTMPPDMPSQPSGRERREFYRITVLLPICIQLETDEAEGEFTEKSVNLSGGGVGVTVIERYTPGEVLSLTLLLPEQVPFKSSIEVLRLDPLPVPGGAHRLHARFVRMTTQNRELLIRYIVRFQRDHLQEHYSV
ncbi:MAG: PilZ domain-containing protein [Nitrospira sp.]|jgi:c-di-GMP-binding flagellar brake protein YcgR|nr:PilZ domain-containing protein [Nitrospira sp.]